MCEENIETVCDGCACAISVYVHAITVTRLGNGSLAKKVRRKNTVVHQLQWMLSRSGVVKLL